MAADTIGVMEDASEQQIDRFRHVLTTLAERNGLTNLRRAGDGHVIADVEKGRTYFDVAGFELQAESLMGARVDVILAQTPSAAREDRGPLVAKQVA